jgi:hypothetical protein
MDPIETLSSQESVDRNGTRFEQMRGWIGAGAHIDREDCDFRPGRQPSTIQLAN